MNIQEATKAAMNKGIAMKRINEESTANILPTNLGNYQCLIVSEVYKGNEQTAYARWQPSADDLLADDWELQY